MKLILVTLAAMMLATPCDIATDQTETTETAALSTENGEASGILAKLFSKLK